jgi:phage-related protein
VNFAKEESVNKPQIVDWLRYISYNCFRKGIYMAFEIEFYSSEDGREPVAEFLDTLDPKMTAKLVGLMEILEEKGTELRMPYSEHLEDGIFELRAKQGNDISRVLYFFVLGKKAILTNGFMKKTKKTPKNEIELAKRYRKDYLNRLPNGR